MKKINAKDIFIPTLSLFLICLFVTAALALTNSFTAEKITENEEQKKVESMQTVLPDAADFNEIAIEGGELYEGTDESGNIVGYAISTASSGYGGQVKVMTGIDPNGFIIGVDVFYNDDETPGLGKNTSNESFTSQYQGLCVDEDIVVSKDNISGNAQTVDAVTSATISSRAVTAAVNKAGKIFVDNIAGSQTVTTFGGVDAAQSATENSLSETQGKEAE